jgi:hypothetical protein
VAGGGRTGRSGPGCDVSGCGAEVAVGGGRCTGCDMDGACGRAVAVSGGRCCSCRICRGNEAGDDAEAAARMADTAGRAETVWEERWDEAVEAHGLVSGNCPTARTALPHTAAAA